MIEAVGCPDAIQSRVMEWCSLTETNVTFSEGWEIWGFTVKAEMHHFQKDEKFKVLTVKIHM